MIAGDVFDSANPPQSAVTLYYNFISDLHRKTNCSTVVTAGNHDSPAHLEAPRHVLAALRTHVVGRLPDNIEDVIVVLPNREEPRLIVAAMPFLRDRDLRTGAIGESAAQIREQLTMGMERRYKEAADAIFDARLEDYPAIGMGHLTVSGCETTPDSERDIHVGGLGTVHPSIFPANFDYMALGHLHKPQQVTGSGRLRYSGSPIPLSFAEANDEKEMRVLDFEGKKLIGNYGMRIPLSRRLVRWRLQRSELEHYLRVKTPPKSDFIPWVQVEVADPHPGENIFETVRELAEGRPYEVVRVGRPPVEHSSDLLLDPNNSVEQADDLLASPLKVFGCRLDMEEDLTESERESLEGAFRELLNLREERMREEEAALSD